MDNKRRAHLTTTGLHPQQIIDGQHQGTETTPTIMDSSQNGTNPTAQLSLLDYLNSYIPEDDNNVPDETGDIE
jgi:hypothetical protein